MENSFCFQDSGDDMEMTMACTTNITLLPGLNKENMSGMYALMCVLLVYGDSVGGGGLQMCFIHNKCMHCACLVISLC